MTADIVVREDDLAWFILCAGGCGTELAQPKRIGQPLDHTDPNSPVVWVSQPAVLMRCIRCGPFPGSSADLAIIAQTLHGTVIDTGGGNLAVRFAHPNDPTDPGWFLAAYDDMVGARIVCYERPDDDGQREWVEVHGPLADDYHRAAGEARYKPLQ